MFRFEHPEHLYALALIPVVLLLFMLTRYARRRALRRFGDSALLSRLMPRASRYRHGVKLTILLTALALLVVGWANPQWGVRREKVKRRGVDVIIALDISQSMLAQDIPPNRMERAKKFAQNLVAGLEGNRIGAIFFAGNAYLQSPITTDYAAVNLFFKSANPNMASTQGTAISEAIDLADASFDEESRNHRALIIISDGENHEEEAAESARTARANGLLLYTVGVGTAEGGSIPSYVGGRLDYKRDENGKPVRSALNETMLEELAKTGDGAYFNLSAGSERIIDALSRQIENIEKRELEQRIFSDYESYFQYFIAGALLLILLEFLIPYRQGKFRPGQTLFQ